MHRITGRFAIFLFFAFLVALFPVTSRAQVSALRAPTPKLVDVDPANQATSATPLFSWDSVTGANSYTIELCKVPFAGTAQTCSSKLQSVAKILDSSWVPTVSVPSNITVYWHVRADSTSYGSSPWSSQASFLSANAPPTPVDLAPVATKTQDSTSAIPITWKITIPSGGVTPSGYDLQVSDDSAFPTGSVRINTTVSNVTSYSIPASTLSPGTQYYWRVRATRKVGTNPHASAWSKVTTATALGAFKTQISTPNLIAPVGNVDVSSTRPTFSWSPVAGTGSYVIQKQNGTAWATVGTVTSAFTEYTPTVDVITNPKGGTITWRVQAKPATGFGIITYSPTATFKSAAAPNAPTLTQFSGVQTSLRPTFKWKSTGGTAVGVINPNSYDLQIATDAGFTQGLITKNASVTQYCVQTGTTTITYTCTYPLPSDLSWGTGYYWRVASKAGSGATADNSAWVTNTTAGLLKINIDLASGLSPAGGFVDSARPNFSWVPVEGATSYTVQWGVNGTTFKSLPAVKDPITTITPNVDIVTAPKGGNIYWRVVTASSGYGSSTSQVSSFTSVDSPPTPVLTTVKGPETTRQPKLLWTTTLKAGTATPTTYQVQIATDAGFTQNVLDTSTVGIVEAGSTNTVLKRSYTPTALLSYGTQYYWRVRSLAGGDASGWSTASLFKTNVAGGTLSAPNNGGELDTTTPLFSWSAVPNAVTYAIKVSLNGGTSFVALAGATIKSPATSYQPTVALPKLASGQTTMYWQVIATGPSGFGTSTSNTFSFIPVTAPNIPVMNLPKNNALQTTLTPTLQWTTAVPTTSITPVSWDLEIATTNTFASGTVVLSKTNLSPTVEKSTVTSFVRSFTTPTLSPATTYYWHVRSNSDDGNHSGWSNASKLPFVFKTPLTAPTTGAPTINFTLGANPNTTTVGQTATLTTQVTGGTATGTIQYEFRCNNTDSYTNIGTVSNTSYSFLCNTLTTAKTYYPQVRITRGGTVVESGSTATPLVVTTAPTPTPTPPAGTQGPGTAGPRTVNVLEVRYFPQEYANKSTATTQLSTALATTLENGSKYRGYKNSSAPNYLSIHKVQAPIDRQTLSPNTGNDPMASLNTILTSNSNQICNLINSKNIDQVWIWFDVSYEIDHVGGTGYNHEYSWIFSNKTVLNLPTYYCGGNRSFLVLGLDENAPYGNAVHSFGHAAEDIVSTLQTSDLFWTRWSGENLTPAWKASICGDVHYPPNGTSLGADGYDYGNTTTVSTSCENWKSDGSGTKTNISCSRWGCTQEGYLTWWMQNMPNYNNGLTYNGKKIPNWFDFFTDIDAGIEYYARRSNEWWMDQSWLTNVNPNLLRPLYLTTFTQATNNASQTMSLNHAFDDIANKPFLLVNISYRTTDPNPQTGGFVNSVTYSGSPLQPLKLADGTTPARQVSQEYASEVWYLPTTSNNSIANPTATHTLAVQFSGPVDSKIVTAYTVNGINQSTPLRGPATAYGINPSAWGGYATHSLSIPSSSTDLVLGFHTIYSGGDPVTSLSSPEHALATHYLNTTQDIDMKTANSTNTTMSWSTGTDYPWNIIGISLRK